MVIGIQISDTGHVALEASFPRSPVDGSNPHTCECSHRRCTGFKAQVTPVGRTAASEQRPILLVHLSRTRRTRSRVPSPPSHWFQDPSHIRWSFCRLGAGRRLALLVHLSQTRLTRSRVLSPPPSLVPRPKSHSLVVPQPRSRSMFRAAGSPQPDPTHTLASVFAAVALVPRPKLHSLVVPPPRSRSTSRAVDSPQPD